MRRLVDTNFLVALVSEKHHHHERAVAFLNSLSNADRLCFCRSVQISFLRMLTTQRAMEEDLCTNSEAVVVYRKITHDTGFELLTEEPPDLERYWMEFSSVNTVSPNIWMDAYLAAWARAADLLFVTFDAGCKRYRGLQIELLKD